MELADSSTRVRVPFDPQPALGGELLQLRPLRPGDFDALFAVAADPLIWEQHPSPDRYQEPVFRAFFRDAIASGGALLVLDRSSGSVIGSSRYHGYDAVRGEVEIGWTFLARSHWGGRYNREMKHLMLHHAFRSVDRVIFVIGPRNHRSRRAVEKLGARFVGTRDEPGGEKVVYAITASEFATTGQAEVARPVPVRLATAADIPALFAVRTSVRENHLDMEQLAQRGVTPESLAEMLASGRSRAWVAEDASGVRAFSMADARDGSIFALFVSPGAEGRGYGRALLEAAEQWLFTAGWRTIWLTTDMSPEMRAHRIYRAAGWVEVGPADHGDVRYEKTRAP